MRTPTLGALASTFVLALAVTGCGGDEETSSTSTGSGGTTAAAGVDQAIADMVPADVKSKGTLTVGSDPTYAPNEFLDEDGSTIIGMDPDLGKAIADVAGLKVQFEKASFDAILPGLTSKKYDLGMSSFTDTKEREAEFDFVTYFTAGTSFFVKAEGGPAVTSLEGICGYKVAVQKGTTQQDDATAQAKDCGSKKADVQVYPDQNGANQALISGRAEVGMADSPIAAYQVKQTEGQFKLSGEPYGTAPYGIALPKGSELAPAIQAALKKLIENGSYAKILSKWGVESGAITEPVINGAES